MRWYRALPPAAVVLAASIGAAGAQTPLKAWPTDAPQPQTQLQPWPGGPPQPQQPQAWPDSRQASAPAGVAPASVGPPAGPSAMGFGPPAQQPGENPCMAEFTRLRGEVEAKGRVAKAVSQRKGSREDLCSAVGAIAAAQTRWVKFAVGRASSCGIPPDVIKQLKEGENHLFQLRKAICSGAPPPGAGPPPAPSLAEALSSTPYQSSASDSTAPKKRGGVLDTLTGTPIR